MTKTIQFNSQHFSDIFNQLLLQKYHLTPYIDLKIAQQIIYNSVVDYDHNLFFDWWKNHHLYAQIAKFNQNTNFATTIHLYVVGYDIYGNIETQNEDIFTLLEKTLDFQFISGSPKFDYKDSFIFEFHNGLYQQEYTYLENNLVNLIPNIDWRIKQLANELYFSRQIKNLKGSDWTQIKLVNCIHNILNDTSNTTQQEKNTVIAEVTNKINRNITIKDLL
ncbi:MAG: hypothetical protein QG564_1129 [Campylobacterota bacterium]|nr:hypothetical protein [Campylobacterota bacterium]